MQKCMPDIRIYVNFNLVQTIFVNNFQIFRPISAADTVAVDDGFSLLSDFFAVS